MTKFKEKSWKKADYPNVNLQSRSEIQRQKRYYERAGIDVSIFPKLDKKDKFCGKLKPELNAREYLKNFKKCEKYSKETNTPIDKEKLKIAKNLQELKRKGWLK